MLICPVFLSKQSLCAHNKIGTTLISKLCVNLAKIQTPCIFHLKAAIIIPQNTQHCYHGSKLFSDKPFFLHPHKKAKKKKYLTKLQPLHAPFFINNFNLSEGRGGILTSKGFSCVVLASVYPLPMCEGQVPILNHMLWTEREEKKREKYQQTTTLDYSY